MLLKILETDRIQGFSRKDGGPGVAPKPAPLELFWAQEDNKPFQNLLEWISQLEDRVLRLWDQPTSI